MRILITGAAGFVGGTLVRRLLETGTNAQTLVLIDRTFPNRPEDPRVEHVAGSIEDAGLLDHALGGGADLVFHLASIPGGLAERDHALGLSVNLGGTLALLEAIRRRGVHPVVVFASTIAVYGSPMPSLVDDETPLRPVLSYGAQKLMGEILIQDYSRRGWIDGRTLRLPGIVARPPEPSGLLSAFMSDMFHAMAEGRPFVCPVSADAVAWWMSAATCADALIHAARLPPPAVADRRVWLPPVLRLTIGDVVEALARRFGAERRTLVTHAPDPGLESVFGRFPPVRTDAAEALGFRHDGSADALVARALGLTLSGTA